MIVTRNQGYDTFVKAHENQQTSRAAQQNAKALHYIYNIWSKNIASQTLKHQKENIWLCFVLTEPSVMLTTNIRQCKRPFSVFHKQSDPASLFDLKYHFAKIETEDTTLVPADDYEPIKMTLSIFPQVYQITSNLASNHYKASFLSCVQDLRPCFKTFSSSPDCADRFFILIKSYVELLISKIVEENDYFYKLQSVASRKTVSFVPNTSSDLIITFKVKQFYQNHFSMGNNYTHKLNDFINQLKPVHNTNHSKYIIWIDWENAIMMLIIFLKETACVPVCSFDLYIQDDESIENNIKKLFFFINMASLGLYGK